MLADYLRRRSLLASYRKRLTAEALEKRHLLTTFTWDGGAATQNWQDPLNWDQDSLPDSDDDVVIGLGAGTIDYDSLDSTVQRIDAQSNLRVLGGRLVVTGPLAGDRAIDSSAAVDD